MRKCAVVYNPESGREVDKRNKASLPKYLAEYDMDVTMCPTKGPKDAIKIVKKLPDDIDLVIACGGDGTLNEGINGNLLREKKLLISQLPIGTVNDVASMYGYSKNIKENINKLMHGTVKNVDTCLINNYGFVYVACIGSYVDVSYNTPRNLKKKYGRLGYLFNAILEFNNEEIKQFDIEFEVDGKRKEGTYSFIFITNTSRMGGFNNLYTDVKLDDNMFEVVLCDVKSKADLLLIGSKILTSEIKKVKEIEYYRTDNFKIKFKKTPPSWVIDGEEFKHRTKEFTFTINKDINMLVPGRNLKKLFKVE